MAIAALAVAQQPVPTVHALRPYNPDSLTIPAAGKNITYYGGPIMHTGADVYVIYYGSWTSTQQGIINGFLSTLGGTSLFNINTTYYDNASPKNFVENVVNFNSSTNTYVDNYSQGKTVNDSTIQTIVSNAISGGHLPNDTLGVYFVLT
jgi:hypothetical protein